MRPEKDPDERARPYPRYLRITWLTSLWAGLAISPLIGCQSFEKSQARSSENNPVVKKISWALRTEPKSLDPIQAEDLSTAILLTHIYQRVAVGPSPYHALASATYSPKSLTISLRLKPGQTFSDGSKLDAKMLAASLLRAKSHPLGSPILLQLASNFGKFLTADSDPLTLTITLNAPDPACVDKLSFTGFCIVNHFVAPQNEVITRANQAVGTGPWILTQAKLDEQCALKERGDGSRTLSFRIVKDQFVRQNLTRKIGNIANFAPHESSGLPKDLPQTKIDTGGFVYIQFNAKSAPALNSRLVRRALAYSIDREFLASKILNGSVSVPKPQSGTTPFPPIAFDPQLARDLLAEAGYTAQKPFPEINLQFADAGRSNPAVDYIVTQWRNELGIPVTARGRDAGSLWKDNLDQQLPIYFTGWSADFPGPWNTIPFLFESNSPENRSGFRSSALDAFLKSLRATKDLFSDQDFLLAGSMIWHEMPIIPLYQTNEIIGGRLSGFTIQSISFSPVVNSTVGPITRK